MAGPVDVPVRQPAVAGLFYPDAPEPCRTMARQLIHAAPGAGDFSAIGGGRWRGGIVPHAGWVCSGAVAAETLATIARSFAPGEAAANFAGLVVVVFGAIHTPLPSDRAALDSFVRWQVPGEALHIASELRGRIQQESPDLFAVDDRFHLHEHAVEVELPLIQQALPGADVLPIEVPLLDDAVEIGKAAARKAIDARLEGVFLASSDLTHYGPAYRFAPAGIGAAGLDWARGNDRRLLGLIERFEPERIIGEVSANSNACGGGAIAAMLAACREFGSRQAKVLRHTNSYETLAAVAPQSPDNAVGYAAVVVG